MNIETIKFACLTSKKNAELRTMSLPTIKSDEILIKQEACNICTTDYQQWQGLREHQGYPMAGGHECSGIIMELGSDIKGTYEIGDRVSIIYDYCGYCDACKHGEVTSCENKAQFGKNYSEDYYGLFGFANYFVRKAKSLVKVDKNLPAAEAGFVEPLSSVIQNMKKLHIKGGKDTVVVIGGGTMGLLNAATAKAMGAKVIVSELMDKKIDVAQKMGLEVINAGIVDPIEEVKRLTGGKGADIVIVAVGVTSANNQALEMVKPKDGKVSLFAAGYPAPEIEVDSNTIHYKRLELIGSYGSTLEDFYDAAQMLSEGRVDVSNLIEESIPLDDIQKAFELASETDSYRVSVKLN
ncbi:hypothetical protein GCM10025886_24810 [Tetragenococcus halophilus subsp. flandriensis]|uniref:zinc-dependent alcohol dehydrogenase n=1 Tax=Tetragenococcus halophilus TaxID=51669 RepID=UPI0023E9DD23|nr:zinc-binding dehydrogenase [Tetragenococcus halophilus]GMA09328.1 hypothetical protein GCM10025886_24810 [Tetragenococcus halophilus subsp. flandriensis]